VTVMEGIWLQLGLVLLLVLVNAAFAGSEVALISLREGQLQRLQQGGGRGRLARDPNQFLSTIQIGITLAGFLASAAAAVTLAEPLVPLLGFLLLVVGAILTKPAGYRGSYRFATRGRVATTSSRERSRGHGPRCAAPSSDQRVVAKGAERHRGGRRMP